MHRGSGPRKGKGREAGLLSLVVEEEEEADEVAMAGPCGEAMGTLLLAKPKKQTNSFGGKEVGVVAMNHFWATALSTQWNTVQLWRLFQPLRAFFSRHCWKEDA